MKIDNETIAIAGVILIVIFSLFLVPSAAEKITLALGGGIIGWMSGKLAGGPNG
jgi:hypothetical protein